MGEFYSRSLELVGVRISDLCGLQARLWRARRSLVWRCPFETLCSRPLRSAAPFPNTTELLPFCSPMGFRDVDSRQALITSYFRFRSRASHSFDFRRRLEQGSRSQICTVFSKPVACELQRYLMPHGLRYDQVAQLRFFPQNLQFARLLRLHHCDDSFSFSPTHPLPGMNAITISRSHDPISLAIRYPGARVGRLRMRTSTLRRGCRIITNHKSTRALEICLGGSDL